MRKLLIVLATFLMVLVLAGAASAITDPEPAYPSTILTDNSAIDGHKMVYEIKSSDTDHDIMMKDLATGTMSYVTSSNKDDRNPDISGNIVVWQREETGGLSQIYWKNMSSGNSPALVHASANSQFNPSISGTVVVWEEYWSAADADTGGLLPDNDIRGYDLATNTYYNFIATSTQYEGSPDISGNTVVYQKMENIGTVPSPNWKWQVYNTTFSSSNAGTKIWGYNANQLNPAISGNKVVWAESTDSNGFDIWYHNLSSGFGKWVATENVDEVSPAISGNVVVWSKKFGSSGDYDIKMKYISNNNPETNPTINVENSGYTQSRPSVSVDNYGIFVSYTDTKNGYNRVYWRNMDSVAPTIASPVNNAVNMARNKITVTFNEPIKAGNMWMELLNSGGTIMPITKSISSNVLTITPSTLLATGTKYTLALHTGSITDYAVNSLVGVARAFTTSTDAMPPTVTSSDPTNNAVNIARNKVITIIFSEPIKAGNMWIELKSNSGTMIPITKSISGNVLTITPSTLLATGTKYNILLHTGSITDYVGNSIASAVRSFTTSSDATAPTVTSSDPTNNAVNIARNKVITITFNEPIKTGNMWIELLNSGGTAIPITKSISGNTLTINHATLLATGTKYTLALHTGSITDYAGNPLAAKVITFTTTNT